MNKKMAPVDDIIRVDSTKYREWVIPNDGMKKDFQKFWNNTDPKNSSSWTWENYLAYEMKKSGASYDLYYTRLRQLMHERDSQAAGTFFTMGGFQGDDQSDYQKLQRIFSTWTPPTNDNNSNAGPADQPVDAEGLTPDQAAQMRKRRRLDEGQETDGVVQYGKENPFTVGALQDLPFDVNPYEFRPKVADAKIYTGARSSGPTPSINKRLEREKKVSDTKAANKEAESNYQANQGKDYQEYMNSGKSDQMSFDRWKQLRDDKAAYDAKGGNPDTYNPPPAAPSNYMDDYKAWKQNEGSSGDDVTYEDWLKKMGHPAPQSGPKSNPNGSNNQGKPASML